MKTIGYVGLNSCSLIMEITNDLIIDSYFATTGPADPQKVVPYTNRISWCNPLCFKFNWTVLWSLLHGTC